MLRETQKAPNFSLLDAQHQKHALKDSLGQWVVLYFYPKDDTPSCTKEACAFRDNQTALLEKNCVIYGISRDNTDSHDKFVKKYDLNFPILSDHTLSVHQAYGVLDDDKTVRATFLIDPTGMIVQVWPKVRVEGHIDQVLCALENFSNKINKG